jgi:hypothetical protein
MSEPGDYLLRVSIRNNRILSRIEAAGFKSLKAFCDKFKLNYTEVADVVRMTRKAKLNSGDWSWTVMNLAAALRCDPEDLFNEKQLAGFKVTSTTRIINQPLLTYDEVEALPAPEASPEASAEQKELVKLALASMSPRQADIVRKRYGLDGEGEATFAEVAEEMPSGYAYGSGHLSVERTRQIEHKGLRRARSAFAQAKVMTHEEAKRLGISNYRQDWEKEDKGPKLVVTKEEAEKEGFSWDK